jgi:hypothetical protein
VISGGEIGRVFGAYLANNDATTCNGLSYAASITCDDPPVAQGNEVTVTGSGIKLNENDLISVSGAYIEVNGVAGYSTISDYAAAILTPDGNTLGNKVTINGNIEISGNVFGASFSNAATGSNIAIGNIVKVTDASIESSDRQIAGAAVVGTSSSVTLQYNQVEVVNVTYGDGQLVAGAYAENPSSGEISYNSVTLSGGTELEYAYGGLAKGAATVAVTNNTLTFAGATVLEAGGGANTGGNANTKDNHVKFTEGTNEVVDELKVFGDLEISGGQKNTIQKVSNLLGIVNPTLRYFFLDILLILCIQKKSDYFS